MFIMRAVCDIALRPRYPDVAIKSHFEQVSTTITAKHAEHAEKKD
jgi:hypothetical protein